MRTSTILLIVCLATAAFAGKNVNEQVVEMLQMTSKAADAVDTGLQVLYDLRQANSDAQDAADERNRTQQAACDSEIADLLAIADANKETGDEATAHRKYLEKEIRDTQAYLEWINNRRAEIAAREEELQDQRCYSNGIFVRSLKEHSDALSAIELLRGDLIPAAESKEGTELVQIKDATKKLAAYKHLFNEQALSAFEQLASAETYEAVDDSTGEWDNRADDNQREGLALIKAANDASGRGFEQGADLIDQINTLLDRLEAHLEAQIAELEQSEVKAAWALAVWLQDSEDETNHLNNEEERRTAYLEKIQISVQAAIAHENKAWEIYFQSATAYHNAVLECIRKGEAYEADRHQRQDEAALIDEVIRLFKEKVSGLGKVAD